MALNAYLRLEGEVQGAIQGSVTQAGREDLIMVYALHHEIKSPRDAASGLPTGKRQHGALTIVAAVDKSTPLLLNALVRNENITEFELKCYNPNARGQEENYYTIQLTNASVSNLEQEMLNNKYEENMKHELRMKVSFCYQKIEWTFVDGGITATDDWLAPESA